MRRITVAVVVSTLAGCATARGLWPGTRGDVSLAWELTGPGEPSAAAKPGEAPPERTTLDVSLAVDNREDAPMVVERVWLEAVSVDGKTLSDIPPERAAATSVIEPGEQGVIEARFEVPLAGEPADVDGFRVAWRVRAGDTTYTRSREADLPGRRYPANHYDYYYDEHHPFYDGPYPFYF